MANELESIWTYFLRQLTATGGDGLNGRHVPCRVAVDHGREVEGVIIHHLVQVVHIVPVMTNKLTIVIRRNVRVGILD